MEQINNYTNTKCELEMAKQRLKLLEQRKEEIYTKYFSLAQKVGEVVQTGGTSDNDHKILKYVEELNEVNKITGMSLEQEIEHQQKKVEQLESYLEEMRKALERMKGIEFRLYYSIVVNGKTPTEAVELIAEESEKETRTIWRYYDSIKSSVHKIYKNK